MYITINICFGSVG